MANYIITASYEPFDCLSGSIKNLYELKTSDFTHYLIDYNFELEPYSSGDIQQLCSQYGINYINHGNYDHFYNYFDFLFDNNIIPSDSKVIIYKPRSNVLTLGFDEALFNSIGILPTVTGAYVLNNEGYASGNVEILNTAGINNYHYTNFNISDMTTLFTGIFAFKSNDYYFMRDYFSGVVGGFLKDGNIVPIEYLTVLSDYNHNNSLRYNTYLEYEYYLYLSIYGVYSLENMTFADFLSNINTHITLPHFNMFVDNYSGIVSANIGLIKTSNEIMKNTFNL